MTEGLKPTSGCIFDPFFKRKSLEIDPDFVEKWGLELGSRWYKISKKLVAD